MAWKYESLRQSFLERGKEGQLNIPEYSSLSQNDYYGNTVHDDRARVGFSCFRWVSDLLINAYNGFRTAYNELYEMGRSDPRKVYFAAKMGLTLTLVSLVIFFKGPLKSVSSYSVWAILTVIVVFEFSIGATLSKGFNRALGTFSAGGLGLGIAELAILSGDFQEVIIIITIFITGFMASYIKLYPTMKPYEYGFRVYLLTYCIVMISGNTTTKFFDTALYRLVFIGIGAAIGLFVNICIYPIWSGEELHKLIVKNFTGVATSFEECVKGYLNCVLYERIPTMILTYQAYEDPLYSGYRAAVESTSKEESLVECAVWEPPHGPYRKFSYPWKSYIKVSGALRHCAFMVMAMHGCILSEIQAPPENRQVFSNELQRVGTAGAKVLMLMGKKLEKMEKLGPIDILFEVHEAAEELQMKIDQTSYLLVNANTLPPELRTKMLDNEHSATSSKHNTWQPELRSKMLDNEHSATSSKHSDVDDTILTIEPSPLASPSAERRSTYFCNYPSNPHWPARVSMLDMNVKEVKTYESASALSLVTFASNLIEFVARLQNLVETFQELSLIANFQEPSDQPSHIKKKDVMTGFRAKFRKWFLPKLSILISFITGRLVIS